VPAIFWVKNIVILLLALFFLLKGVTIMINSYNLNNPLEFVMYFFSASLVIMVCIVGLIYVYFQIIGIKRDKSDVQ